MTDWKNRIVGYRTEQAGQLTGNPRNPRRHPMKQRAAVKGSLDTLGWIAPILVNVRTGYIVDGHERVMQALGMGDDTLVPVIDVDLSEEEEAQVLATFDFITYMATYDRDTLDALLTDVATDNADVKELLDELATAPMHNDYSPNLNPSIPALNVSGVTDEDVLKKQQQMDVDARRTAFETRPMMCPHCGETFYVSDN